MIYDAQSRETISDSLTIGSVIAGLGQNSMRDHLLRSATKCDSWSNFVRVDESIEHAKTTVSAPTPMEIEQWTSESLEWWSDQSWQTDADSVNWREDDWYTAESSSDASAAAEEFQHDIWY